MSESESRDSSFDGQPYEPFHTQTCSNTSEATRPGLVPLSRARLHRMHPELYTSQISAEEETLKLHIAEHLRYGLAEPALVLQLQPLIIAVYTRELDAVVHLGFFSGSRAAASYGYCVRDCHARVYPAWLADEFVQRQHLQVGSRLLTVNTFQLLSEEIYASDIMPGPRARGCYGNFSPYIAKFLTSDQDHVKERKKLIEEREW